MYFFPFQFFHLPLFCCPFTPEEHIQVEEQHYPEVNAEATYLVAQCLYGALRVAQEVVYFQDVQSKADVEQVEPDFEQAVGGYSYLFAAVKDVPHKNQSVFKQCIRYIPGQAQYYRKINEIRGYYKLIVHD